MKNYLIAEKLLQKIYAIAVVEIYTESVVKKKIMIHGYLKRK